MRACVRGCERDDEPVLVEAGYLCDRCRERLRAALVGAPSLVAYIRASMVPMPSQVYDRDIVGGGGSSFGQPPMNVDAVDAVDAILWTLRGWAMHYGDEFPYQSMTATLPPGTPPHVAAQLIAWPSRYLVENLDLVCNDERVLRMSQDILDWPDEPDDWTLKKAASRWPQEQHGFYSKERCGSCGLRAVWVVPPSYEGGSASVRCKKCRWVPVRQDEFDKHVGIK